MSNTALLQIQRDLANFKKDPVPHIEVELLDSNILECHFIFKGTENSLYAGGYYHGKIVFPRNYPSKPPAIYMITPNGRFPVNRSICLVSISHEHPSEWWPKRTLSSMLVSIFSFMLDYDNWIHLGGLRTSKTEKKKFAAASLEFNLNDPVVKTLFPDLYEEMEIKFDALLRIQRDLENFKKDPVLHIEIERLDSNIHEYHFLFKGTENSLYAGGYYHGKIIFPNDYPFKLPVIYMITPNGRFSVNQSICLMSISHEHPSEGWQKWTISSMLMSIFSFMLDYNNTRHEGGLWTSEREKKKFAADSLKFNLNDPVVKKLFPDLCKEMKKIDAARRNNGTSKKLTIRFFGRKNGLSDTFKKDSSYFSGMFRLIKLFKILKSSSEEESPRAAD
ncbi:hypothetical protein QYM36_007134 [Artemia franciscana]|uniref:UBC core domain-containing protein n=1 Tax=Artemia franciscana TaxID=6661 RepID=A0AA88HW17_ARTSF|nr:hypothetical protein QYM36_007134 [Artemia franciscana]